MNQAAIKIASTTYPIHSLLTRRWSPRAFSTQKIEPGKLQRIFEASRWAPSASNVQPWYFLVGFQGDLVYSSIFETLVEFNQLWVNTAPVLGLAICRVHNPKGGENSFRTYDLGQSMAHMSIQAMEEGVYMHQMGGFDSAKATNLLNIPGGYEVKVAFTLGYPGDPEILHPNLKSMEYAERSRRPVAESVFTGQFGSPASFL